MPPSFQILLIRSTVLRMANLAFPQNVHLVHHQPTISFMFPKLPLPTNKFESHVFLFPYP
jgi:hypothetical protein